MSTGKMLTLLGALLLVGAAAARAATDAEKCEAGKNKIAGKYAACLHGAVAKAVKKGSTPDFSKCDAKFADKWAGTESKAGGMCPSNGDAAAMQSAIMQHADDIAACVSGACTICGDATLGAGEECDFGTVGGATCVTQGFAGGTLGCTPGCTFDTSGCYTTRFVDNADGTITDNATGRMWEKKTELDFNYNAANLHDADNFYNWAGRCSLNLAKLCQPTAAAAALCAANADGNALGCDECTGGDGTCMIQGGVDDTIWSWAVQLNTAHFAGYSDWRVPTRNEFQHMIGLALDAAFQGASCGPACTDITDPDCSCTDLDANWSASVRLENNDTNAWTVEAEDGRVEYDGKDTNYDVRAVRGGP